jgi:hypothetical protein
VVEECKNHSCKLTWFLLDLKKFGESNIGLFAHSLGAAVVKQEEDNCCTDQEVVDIVQIRNKTVFMDFCEKRINEEIQ